MVNRIEGLDLLRGVCAVGVAIYHFSSWLQLGFVSANIGYYFVYIFFVISGASLYMSYSARLSSATNFKNFILIRYFRLAPLFALVVALTPFIRDASFSGYDLSYLLKSGLNITFAFGLGNPGIDSLVAGGWSLGIEFAYYLIFPIFLAFLGLKYSILVFALQIIFVNLIASQNSWGPFIQPLAFIWYFYSGCFLALICEKIDINLAPFRRVALIIAMSFVIFLLFDKPLSMADVLTGWRSVVMPILCVVLVFSMFHSINSKIVNFLGQISYGFYLIHPLVFYQVQRHLGSFDIFFKLAVFLIATTVVAYLINRFVELPCLSWAKNKFPVTTT
jgi:peptidoglycan/LPS O-acetylase OafA/YrhL